jgi:pseudomonalisin
MTSKEWIRAKIRWPRAFPVALTVAWVAGLTTVASAEAQSSWSGTQTHAHPTGNAKLVAYLPDSEKIDLVVALKLRNPDQVTRKVAALTTRGSQEFRHWLTPAQVLSDYAPLNERAQAVADYLSQAGFTGVQVAANRLLVTATGTAAAVRRAFNTELARFARDGHEGIANTKDVSIPTELSDTVLSVLGLQTLDKAEIFTVAPQSPAAFSGIYAAASLPTAANTVVGIITEGSMTQTLRDLAAFQTASGLPAISTQVIDVGSGPWTDTSGTGEWNLDSQDIQGMAGSVKQMRFYAASCLSDSCLTQAYNQAVTENLAKVINVSIGFPETTVYADGAMAADDQIFATAVMQGQTFSIASGDHGAYACGTLGGNGSYGTQLCADYPASSPYVVAVGGTTLSTSSGVYSSEVAWAYSGGGPSLYEAQPSWQSGVVPGTTRGVPDLAFDADPSSGALIFYNGTQVSAANAVGGTSLSSPLFVGAWARVESAQNNSLGFAAPWIYSLAKENPAAFHDITSGSNGNYSAAAGWDYTTGWGSLNVAALSGTVTRQKAAIQAITAILLLN